MAKMVKVGMADLNICHSPDAITTLGLGSCVGVALYDKNTKTAGLVHVMLPDSTKVRQNQNRAKFADTGIDYLIELLEKEGAKKSSLTAKIAGGAQMFAFSSSNDMLRVGERNVEAVKDKLKKLGIRVLAEDTGLNYGRTVEFYPETGDFIIKSVGFLHARDAQRFYKRCGCNALVRIFTGYAYYFLYSRLSCEKTDTECTYQQ